jgi:hypothetical protein
MTENLNYKRVAGHARERDIKRYKKVKPYKKCNRERAPEKQREKN